MSVTDVEKNSVARNFESPADRVISNRYDIQPWGRASRMGNEFRKDLH